MMEGPTQNDPNRKLYMYAVLACCIATLVAGGATAGVKGFAVASAAVAACFALVIYGGPVVLAGRT
jgi:hypothetical protein